MLRREGIYSSHLTTWRRERDRNQLAGLTPRKRGPKVDEQAQRLAQLERENARLQAKLGKAELIIDAQKKLLQVIGMRRNGRSAWPGLRNYAIQSWRTTN